MSYVYALYLVSYVHVHVYAYMCVLARVCECACVSEVGGGHSLRIPQPGIALLEVQGWKRANLHQIVSIVVVVVQ